MSAFSVHLSAICLVFGFCLYGIPPKVSYGQAAEALSDQREQEIESILNRWLQKHISIDNFFVSATITLKTPSDSDQKQLPYLISGTTRPLTARTLREFWLGVSSAQITIGLSERYTAASREKIQIFAIKRLKLPENLQSFVETVSIEMTDVKEVRDLNSRLQQSRQELLSKEQQVTALQQTTDQMRTELQTASLNNQRLVEEVASLKNRLTAASSDASTSTAPATTSNETNGEDADVFTDNPLLLLGSIGFAIFLLCLALIMAFSILGKNIKKSASSLSDSLAKLAPKGRSNAQPIQDKPLNPASAKMDQPTLASMDHESQQKYLEELQQQIYGQMQQDGGQAIVSLTAELIAQGNNFPMVVAGFEYLGREKAEQIFHLLQPGIQNKLRDYLRQAPLITNKTQLMRAYAETVLVRILKLSFDSDTFALDTKIENYITGMDSAELLEFARSLSQELLERFQVYLSADQLSLFLGEEEEFNTNLLEALANYPAARQKPQLDKELSEKLAYWLQVNGQSDHSDYKKWYLQLLDKSDDSTARKLIEIVKAKDPKTGLYLGQNVITIGSLFRLEAVYRQEVLDQLELTDLAALLSGIEEEQQRNQLKEQVPESLRSTFDEEVQRLDSVSPLQKRQSFQKSRAILVQMVKRQIERVGPEILQSDDSQDSTPPLEVAS